MKMNRRNVLVGLGALGIGGGALLGSGAFTSVEATRDVEVNVITGPDISDEFVDVFVWAGEYGTVGVGGDAGDLFPTDNSDVDDATADHVSLIDNDVTITFGADGGLPPNSTTSYNDLFLVVNEEGDEAENFNVDLELSEDSFLTIEDDGLDDPVPSGGSVSMDASVDTEDDDDSDELTIVITQA